MIIKEIPILPQPFTQNPINAVLNGQQVQITISTLPKLDKYSLMPKGCMTIFDMNCNNQIVTRGMECRARANLVFTQLLFNGYVFFYAQNTTVNPLFPQFGTVYKLIFSDTYAFDVTNKQHNEFINELNKLFTR